MVIEAFSRYICSYMTEKEESLLCGAPLSLTHTMMVDTYLISHAVIFHTQLNFWMLESYDTFMASNVSSSIKKSEQSLHDQFPP
jgi:hypothetical protein